MKKSILVWKIHDLGSIGQIAGYSTSQPLVNTGNSDHPNHATRFLM